MLQLNTRVLVTVDYDRSETCGRDPLKWKLVKRLECIWKSSLYSFHRNFWGLSCTCAFLSPWQRGRIRNLVRQQQNIWEAPEKEQ